MAMIGNDARNAPISDRGVKKWIVNGTINRKTTPFSLLKRAKAKNRHAANNARFPAVVAFVVLVGFCFPRTGAAAADVGTARLRCTRR